jgi:hypothetical protein
LAGSAIGALASFATTWLTQHAQECSARFEREVSRREHLYGEFIDEGSRLFTDALTHQRDEPSRFVHLYAARFVHLYAVTGKLRLFAPAKVVTRADQVMRYILQTYEPAQ